MTNLPKLSPRAQKALDVLADGGRFVQRLERDPYTRREQFQYRLCRNLASGVVKGVGIKAFYELRDAGMIISDGSATSVATYYKLRSA